MAEEKKEHKKKHAGHGFLRSHAEHHHDGSITVHHEHSEGPHMDVKHAVSNLDGLHDSLQENLGHPNPDEAEAESGMHADAMQAGAASQGA